MTEAAPTDDGPGGWLSPSRVWVQASPRDRRSWLDLARDVEARGCAGLLVPDHPGSSSSPFVALAAAAAVTDALRLGPCVANAGVWHPVDLAAEAATLDVLSGGRALLGIGAGHTPVEWTARGLAVPGPGVRATRLEVLTDATRRLLAGQAVTLDGGGLVLDEAVLEQPRPVQDPVPLLIGAGGPRLLAFAARTADRVNVSGLGATLADGHRHAVRWSADQVARTFDVVHRAAARAGRSPAVDALVQAVVVTDDAEAAAAQLAADVAGAEPGDLLGAPFAWIGTPSEIAAQVRAHQQALGIDGWVVRGGALAALDDVLDR